MSDQTTNDKLKIFIYGYDSLNPNNDILFKLKSCCIYNDFLEIGGSFTTNYWEHNITIDDEGSVRSFSPQEVFEMVSNTNNYLIIISATNDVLINHIKTFKDNNFKNFVPNFYLKSNNSSMGATLNSIHKFNQTNSSLFVVSPLLDEIANLYKTLTENKIDFIDFENEPNRFGFFNKYDKIKIIVTIQEPISHILSMIYQQLSSPYDNYFNLIMRKSFKNQEDFLQKIDNIYLFFTLYTQKRDKLPQTLYMDRFIEIFNNQIVNLFQHDFDKEKGYSIIKQGEIEVFVYQQEKMNDIVDDLSTWIGENKFTELKKSDSAIAKWIKPHYKLAQKEIKFSQGFFDNCYNQDWVKHFYSDYDIQKRKERWQTHIVN